MQIKLVLSLITCSLFFQYSYAAKESTECPLQAAMKKNAIERDAVGNKIVVPLGFSKNKEVFAYLKKMANCRCNKTNEKAVCEVYSYVDEERVPCSPDGIDEIVLQDLRIDQRNILKKAKKPSEPILCDEAFNLLEEQGISVTSPEIKQFPALLHGNKYTAAIRIIPQSNPKVDRANYIGEEMHEVLFSSAKGEKKIGVFKNCCGSNSALS